MRVIQTRSSSRRSYLARRSWVEHLEDRRLLTVSTFFASASLQTSDSTPHASPTPLAPYPIDIHVSGVGDTLNNVTLTISYSSSRRQDLDFMLVSPTGQSLVVASDLDVNANRTLTFDDDAPGFVTVNSPNGSYKPTDLDPGGEVDVFAAPAPAPTAATTLSVFEGNNPNGIWKLYAMDDDTASNSNNFTFSLSVDTVEPPKLLISEYRTVGTNGALDEFVEFYNPSTSPLTVSVSDGSGGWALAANDGVARFVIPNGTVIPPRAHYLAANNSASGYSLGSYATPNITWTANIKSGFGSETVTPGQSLRSGIALFRTSNPANFGFTTRMDAAGVRTFETNPLYYETQGHNEVGSSGQQSQFSYHRVQRDGLPQDLHLNNADFLPVGAGESFETNGILIGGPGPENLASPIQINDRLPATLLDAAVSADDAPNRVRSFTPVVYDGDTTFAFGTYTIRRTFTNTSGGPITRLRFRVVQLGNAGAGATAPGGGDGDLRVVSSSDQTVSTSGGNVLVRGTTLEQPPNHAQGGGVNSTLAVTAITAGTPLAAGASISVQFVVALNTAGGERLRVNAEAIVGGAGTYGPGTGAPTADTAVAPTTPGRPDLDPASDSGVSSTDDITSDSTPTMTGASVTAGALIHVYSQLSTSNTPFLLGTTTANGSGVWTYTPSTPLVDGVHWIQVTQTVNNVTSRATSVVSSFGLNLRVDTVAPAIIAPGPTFSTSPQHQIVYNFNENVSGFFTTADLNLVNVDTGEVISQAAMSIANTFGTQATITFPGLPNAKLPVGIYRMTIDRTGMVDLAGNMLAANHLFDIAAVPPLMITELRTRGPNGVNDEYVELFNPGNANVTVSTTDASSGWAVVAGDGTTRFVIPNGTVIKPRQSYLATNNAAGGYSLGTYATSNINWTTNIPEAAGVALFNTSNVANFTLANRIDAAGPATEANTLYREGTGFPSIASNSESAWVRDRATGRPRDTDNNAGDFIVVDTAATTNTATVRHGAPGPQNLASPLSFNGYVPVALLDAAAAANAAPNRVRDVTPGPTATSSFGTLTIRRKVTNPNPSTGVVQLRFRVVDLLLDAPGVTAADLRPISSSDVMVATSGGTVLVKGSTVEQPPTQATGGGLNSTFVVNIAPFLGLGASVNVQFVFGFERPGDVRLAMSAEANFELDNAFATNPESAGPFVEQFAALPSPPPAELAPASDTGLSNTDGLTNDTTPTLMGTVNPGSTVQIFDGDTLVGTTTANGSGDWSFTPGVQAQGAHAYRILTTISGVQSQFSPDLNVVIDTTAPATPAAPDLAFASDTGVSGTDNLTNDTTPEFAGTVEANATVDLLIDSVVRGTTTSTGGGGYSVTASTAVAAGVRQATVRVTDAAGNVGTASAALAVTIDTTAPTLSGTPVFSVSPNHQLVYTFTENVSQTLTTADLTLMNLTTGQTVPAASLLITFNGPGTQATVTFPGFASGRLPPAEYRMTLSNAGVTDPAGNVIPPPDNVVDFSTLPPLIISELRTRGPAGARDEYVELYNPAATPLTISVSDGSTGWSLVSSDGIIRFTVPNGTVIPARGHYLGANNGAGGYSLGAYATPDATFTLNIPDNGSGEGGVNRGVALFRTSNPANFISDNRLDAAGPTGETNALYREGTGYANVNPALAATAEFALFRNAATGRPVDTDSNAADFQLVDPTGNPALATGNRWGAPGPENRTGAVQINGQLGVALVDAGAAATATPNRQRDLASGTLTIRRRFTNNTGGPITLLRFRVADLTNDLTSSVASVLRAVTSSDATVSTTGGSVLVRGTTLETPPNQPNGGGLNSTLRVASIAVGTPLAAGASVDVQFVFNVVENGDLNVVLNAEALFNAPGAAGPGTGAPFSDTAIAPTALVPDLDAGSDSGVSNVDDITNDNTPTLTGVTSPNAIVQLFDGATLLGSTTAGGGGNWSITPGTPLGDGAHTLRTAVTANNVSSRLSPALNVTVDTAIPTADVVDVTPDPRTTVVGSITISFGQAVTGFDLSDLSLTRGGGATSLTGSSLTSSDGGVTWTLGNLAGLTAISGTYVLTLVAGGSGVADLAGNPLAANASDTWVLSTPTWLTAGSNTTWNVTTKALTVGGVATITADPGADLPLVTASGPGASLTIAPSSGTAVNLGGLTVTGGATTTVSAAGATRVLFVNGANFSVSSSSRLDLNDNALVLRSAGSGTAGQSATRLVTGYLKAGLENNGAFDWLGTGVFSTTAATQNSIAGSVLYGVGVFQNNLAAAGTSDGTTTDQTAGGEIVTSFAGQAIGLNDVFVRYTYMGDADLDGAITGTDYSLIDAGFGAGLKGWLNGDFDYSGGLDGTDYALIDNSFGSQSGPPNLVAQGAATAARAEGRERERVADSVLE